MIFKTKNNELAIFGKTLSETRENLIAFFEAFERGGIKGQDGIIDTFFSKSKKSLLTPELLDEFERFKKKFNSTSLSAEALAEQLKNVDQRIIDYAKTYKNGELTTEGFKASIEGLSFSAKAGQVTLQALATAGNMLAMWAISEAVQLFQSCVTASKRLQEAAKDLGSQFSSTQSDIEGYKAKISELYSTISDSSSSYEDTCNARRELLTIQDEMIEKFGNEADAVRLVTDAVNGQTEALDSLSRDKWNETVDKFNYDSGRKWTEKFGDAWSNFWSGSSNNYERMLNEMEDTSVSLELTPRLNDADYASFVKVLEDNFDLHIQSGITKTLSGYKAFNTIKLEGNLNDIYSRIQNIKALAQDMGLDDSYINALSEQTEKIKSRLDSYQEIYSQYVLYDKILDNNAYEQSFKDINDAYKKYQEAFVSGDKDAVEKAKQDFAEVIQSATDGVTDDSVIDFFTSMYPDLQEEVNGWLFEVHFKAALDDDKDHFENDVKDALGKFTSSDEILGFHANSATPDEQIAAYAKLKEIASDCNLSLDQLIAKAEQLGLIQSTTDIDFDNSLRTLSGPHEKRSDLTEYTKDFTSAQKKLWLEATHGAENAIQAIAMYEEKLSETDMNALPVSLSTQLIVSQGSLDKFQSSVQSAYNAYSTLLSGNYSSSELLESVQTMNQAAKDMNGSINWEVINDRTRSLETLGNVIDYVAGQYADSILFEAGIDPGSDFGNMLANSIIQSQKAATQLEVLNSQIDSLQGAYNNLTDAVNTYNQYGYITFDQLQNFLSMESQYLECLINENGQLQLNGLAIQELAARRLYDAKVQAVNQAIAELGTLTYHDEQIAVENNAHTFGEATGFLAGYNTELANTIVESGVAASLIRNLNAAITGAEDRGASDIDVQAVLNNLNAKMKLIGSMENGNIGNMFSGFSSSAKSAIEDATKELDAYIDLQEKALDAGEISYKEYCSSISSYIRKAYDNGKLSAEEFWNYQDKFLDKQINSYDKVINAVTNRIDEELDRLQEQKEAVENSYQVKIDAIQSEIDALNEANDARKAQIDLEKAQYEAERARNQRVSKVFDGSQFVYSADTDAIRDAEEELADRKLQSDISLLEGQIDSLKAEMENATKSLDLQISALEAYKGKWNEISGVYEEQQNRLIAAEILGADWEMQILDGRLGTLQSFTEQYIALQQAQADAAVNAARIKSEADAGNLTGGKVGNTPDSGRKNGNDNDSSTPPNSGKWYIVNQATGEKLSSGFDSSREASKYLSSYAGMQSNHSVTLKKFHKGLDEGYVTAPGKSKPVNKSLELIKKLANDGILPDEFPAILQHGELVITPEQQENLISNARMAFFRSNGINPETDGYRAISHIQTSPQNVYNNISINCPNVTNNTGAEYILKSLQRLPLDTIQYTHRRQ